MIPEWVIAALQGRASSRERRTLDDWRRSSDRREHEYRTLERLWRLTEGAEAEVATRRPSAAELLRAHAEPPTAVPPTAVPRTAAARVVAPLLPAARTSRRTLRAAVGAAAAVLVAAAGWVTLGRQVAPAEHATGIGEMETVRLEDGSVVRLAPESRLEVPGDRGRQVRLEGRAFFAVAHDAGRPFVVETSAGRIRVLGTRFTLDAAGDTLRIAVVEGRVAVDAAGAVRELGAGEASIVVRGAPPAPPRVSDVHVAAAWLGSTIILQETPLRDAAREVERVHGLTLRIADSALAGRTVTAVFRSDDADEVLATLCRAVQARCERAGAIVDVHPE